MTSKKFKLADIAELAGVSKSTVSFVLNGHAKKHRINEATVKKVEAIAKKYNYSPSIYARALKSKQTYTIGLVIPDLTNMGFAHIAKALEAKYRESGYQLLIASSEDDPKLEQQAIQSLIERQIDLLLVATSMTDDVFLSQVKRTTPVILFDRTIDSPLLTSIRTDSASATAQVVAHLVEDIHECAYIGGQHTLSPSRDRFSGYKTGLEQAGVPFQSTLVLSKDYQSVSGYQMMAQLTEQLGRLPQSVFTASYSLLEGVLRYLTEHQLLNSGIRIGTFDNYDILDCLPINIDSAEQDCELIAKTLFEQSKALLSDPSQSIQHTVIPAKIHIRRNAQLND
ncbi:sucrose operon repressor [Vibrio sp. qd031]|uniref:LacI family DNA-binding transcriptional regulator n=1 Tax=Vibrio sp. qd031 TaxID=1603038 RepID=UPI000A10BAD1|nr:LacI family DNA-binding transcriptional regulator [Vibrio sp. qd031]ORT49591.1 sucrose operon repressor [Vibrio sp. qd031]